MKSSTRSGATWFAPREAPASANPTVVPHDNRFFLFHAWLPLAAFVLLAVVSMGLGGDEWLADRLYAWEGHRWLLRNAWVATGVHQVGREASTIAWLGALAAWIVARSRPGLATLRRPLAYLVVAVAVSTLLVAWLKSWSNMDCPWDLVRYGGERPYVGLFSMRPIGLSRGSCFPAGHASGGYAWWSLYFFLLVVRPDRRWLGLVVGGAFGLMFGITQQLRGAHFLSHDVFTAAICWATALLVYLLFWHRTAGNGRAAA